MKTEMDDMDRLAKVRNLTLVKIGRYRWGFFQWEARGNDGVIGKGISKRYAIEDALKQRKD